MTSQQSQPKLFLIGPGFIGGTFLSHLLSTRGRNAYHLTVLTRRPEQAEQLRSLGIHEPVIGSLDDTDLIARHASQADVVIHAATADHQGSALAVAKGLSQRDPSRGRAVYIHTSGNDELVGAGKPSYSRAQRTISDSWQDKDIEARLLPNAYHRDVDGALRKEIINDEAEERYNVRAVIMMPPLIYGIGPKEYGSRISIQTPMLARSMLSNGRPFTLPDGHKGGWNAVEVNDLARAYLVVLEQLEKSNDRTGKGRHYVFPSEPEPFEWKKHFDAVAQAVAKARGKGDDIDTVESLSRFEELIGGKSNPYSPCFVKLVYDEENNGFTGPDRLTKEWGFKHQANRGSVVHSVVEGGELEELLKKEVAAGGK